MSDAQPSLGTTFEWNSNAVAKLTSIGSPNVALNFIDVTTYDSSGGYRERIPGLFDPGTLDVEGYFDSGDTTGQLAMVTDFNAKTLRAVAITFPTLGDWSFNAYISGIDIGPGDIETPIHFRATLQISGTATLATV